MVRRRIAPEQLGAILRFARRNGRLWKSKLQKAWLIGTCSDPALQALRNTHGPEWLKSFRL